MSEQFNNGDVVERRALDEEGRPVGETLVVRRTGGSWHMVRPPSEPAECLSIKETNPMDITASYPNALTDILGRLLPMVEKWLEAQVGHLESEKAPKDQRMLTPDEAAKEMRLHVQTVMAWCRTGKLKGIKIGGNEINGKGGKWLIPRKEIDAYLHRDRLIKGPRKEGGK